MPETSVFRRGKKSEGKFRDFLGYLSSLRPLGFQETLPLKRDRQEGGLDVFAPLGTCCFQ